MQVELLELLKQIALSDVFVGLVASLISWLALRVTAVLESRKDFDALRSGIKSIVMFVQKDMKHLDGLVKGNEAYLRITERYKKKINKLGFTEQEVKELLERVYEELKQSNPTLFENIPVNSNLDSIDLPVYKEEVVREEPGNGVNLM